MAITAIYQRPNTSKAAADHKIYPYLLRKLPIVRPNQVWATDITYVPMARGFVYLIAIVDWFSPRVLSWRLSITMETDFCVEALEEALTRFGTPDIFNTDQCSQFAGATFTSVLLREKIAISMDGRGAWRDSLIVERLWRSVKYEEVYLHALRQSRRRARRRGMITSRHSTYKSCRSVQTNRASPLLAAVAFIVVACLALSSKLSVPIPIAFSLASLKMALRALSLKRQSNV